MSGKNKTYNISSFDVNETNYEKYKTETFYKERWINEGGLEQRLIVTFSLKYRDYQRQIRSRQVERAIKQVENNPSSINKKRPNDPKRFIISTNVTKDGEIADEVVHSIDEDAVASEEKYDGFYAVCTNLEDAVPAIVKINHGRWEIEESFRIMKSEFKARPVYLSRDDRIRAHFTTCFLALTIYRFLEKRLEEKFTTYEIISNLKDMNFERVPHTGYIPTYTRNDFTDALHDVFGFKTDYEIVSEKQIKEILKDTKN